MIDVNKCGRLLEQGTIEVAPLAFMRGRTLSKAFVILDEAQNTTPEQMKMFLTRLGVDSKAVVTGDMTQVDLPDGRPSGLRNAHQVLSRIREIPFVEFTAVDVVRHRLVQRIVEAYAEADQRGRAR
jgi:phosphate starvation-inducible PhoH-like protein